MKLIKEVVKENLWRKKMTLGQFADLIEVTPQSLSKIFDKNSTTIQLLEKMSITLGISMKEFFEESVIVQEPEDGYTTIKNEELIKLQRLALGNMEKELDSSKNHSVVSK